MTSESPPVAAGASARGSLPSSMPLKGSRAGKSKTMHGRINPRLVRLVSGLIIFVYVTAHLINLALGNISVDAMQAGVHVAVAVWRSWPGTIALYGALLAHTALGYWALYERRMFRYRSTEVPQLVLGLLIPFMLINHIIVTRGAYTLHGVDKGYVQELYQFWVASPFQGVNQALVLLVAWIHGCIGVHLWLRLKPWYKPVALVLLAVAVLVPALALLGFYQGGRVIAAAAQQQSWLDLNAGPLETGTIAEKAMLANLRNAALAGFALLLLLVFALRALRYRREASGGLVKLTYPDRRTIRVPAGMSLLEASTRYEMPHAGVCGGRGRCGTCRVAVLSGSENLPAPTEIEQAILDRIGSAPGSRIRIGCQARPTGDVTIVPILPPHADPPYAYGKRRIRAGRRRRVICLFVEFTDIAAHETDRNGDTLLFTVNRFIEAAIEAVTRSGGTFNRLSGAGMLALFEAGRDPAQAARRALDAAAMIGVNIEHTARLIGSGAGSLPFVIGMAEGEATVGDISYLDEVVYTALGGVVRDAADLCNIARTMDCEVVISASLYRTAGVGEGTSTARTVTMPGSDRTLAVHCADEAVALFGVLDTIADKATQDVNAFQVAEPTGL